MWYSWSLPEEGTTVSKDDEVVVIESVKAASDILAPVDGEITEVNTALADNPGLINEDPQGEAWFFKMKHSVTRARWTNSWTKPGIRNLSADAVRPPFQASAGGAMNDPEKRDVVKGC